MTTREEDFARQIRIASTHDDILFFTNRGRVYTLKCYRIPEAGRTAKGTAIVNLLPLTGGERVTTMIPMPDMPEGHFMMMATRDGYIKKTPLSEFENLRKSGIIAIALPDDDELVGVELSNGQDDVMLSSRQGMAVRFNEKHVRAMGRTARGVHSMKLAEGDEVIDMAVVEEGGKVLSITELGYGKRTDPEEFTVHGRNGKGVLAMKLTEKTGSLTAQLLVQDDEDILLITDDGTIIRTPADEIRVCGRVTQGVRLMRIQEGSRVIGVARAEREEPDLQEEETPAPSDEDEV